MSRTAHGSWLMAHGEGLIYYEITSNGGSHRNSIFTTYTGRTRCPRSKNPRPLHVEATLGQRCGHFGYSRRKVSRHLPSKLRTYGTLIASVGVITRALSTLVTLNWSSEISHRYETLKTRMAEKQYHALQDTGTSPANLSWNSAACSVHAMNSTSLSVFRSSFRRDYDRSK